MNRSRRSLLSRTASFAGAAALTIGLTAPAALGAVTPPDMFGIVPNYANSPLPVVQSNPALSIVGNAINADRQYATDFPALVGDRSASRPYWWSSPRRCCLRGR